MDNNLDEILNTVQALGGHICVAEDSEETRKFEEYSTQASKITSEPIEAIGVHSIKTKKLPEVTLNYFVDGVQRSLVISKLHVAGCGYFPVYYSTILSGIIHRENRHLSVWEHGENEYLEQAHIGIIPKTGISEYITNGNICYYQCTDGEGPHKVCNTVRKNLEIKCLEQWCSQVSLPNYILVDGGISHLKGKIHNAIGLIKSVQTPYMPPDQFKEIITKLQEGQRSHLFQIKYPDHRGSVISCFIRLHKGQDLTGLVRFEAPDTLLTDIGDNMAAHLNTLITHIIEENVPSIYPTIRWDRQLYPVQACEDFLRTHIPSLRLTKALIESHI